MAANGKFKVTKLWLPVFICMGVIFYASSLPGSDIPSLFRYEDILYHFLIYFLLGYLFSRALKNTFLGIPRIKIILLTTIFGIIYGLTDEWHQAFVPLRTVSVFDLFIDSLAGCMGSALFAFRQLFQPGRKICLK
ncbi:MAG: VanZ family protein [Candidatus Omnitrophota bacterium]